jgi:ankyrin repeat protein
VNELGKAGQTPLHFALLGPHLDMLSLLIEKGADVNAHDSQGASPLDDAVWRGQLDAVAMLLAHGARLNDPHTQTGATPVNEAAFRGNTQVIRYLLGFHPDLSIPDQRGYTPLDNAIRMRKEDAALVLLEAEPQERQTPEFFAKAMAAVIGSDQVLLARALISHGVEVNTALPSGYTPLDIAAFDGAVKVTRFLLESGADPNLEGKDGTTPLEDASAKGFDVLAGMLLDHGALVNHPNTGSGSTPLYSAALFGNVSLVKLLLARGANPLICGTNRKSPYQAALENGQGEVAAEIRDHGGASRCQ